MHMKYNAYQHHVIDLQWATPLLYMGNKICGNVKCGNFIDGMRCMGNVMLYSDFPLFICLAKYSSTIRYFVGRKSFNIFFLRYISKGVSQ